MIDITTLSREKLLRLRKIIEQAVELIEDDSVAIEATTLFPEWAPDVPYTKDTKVKYNDVLYRVLQDHTSQATWTPTDAPSLFAKVLIPDPDVIPEWEQPDSTNPYMTGDKVLFEGAKYESTVDNNVWAPNVYGWKAI